MVNMQKHNFLGQYYHKIDDHNRLLLPSKLFGSLNLSSLVVSKGFDKNVLVLRTLEDFDAFCQYFNTWDTKKSTVRSVQRLILSHSFQVEIDKHNRIILPKTLISNVKLTKEVTLIGVIDKVELWSKSAWEKEFLKTEDDYSAQLEDLG